MICKLSSRGATLAAMEPAYSAPTLARRLGFFALIVYGIGDILGAGIYALVGKVVGIAGAGAWATFLIAALAAILTGLSYAELTARFPVAGGAAAFVRRAFPGKLIATLIGVFVLGTGMGSAATVTTAFSGYLQQLIPFPEWPAQVLLVAAMSFLSFWGIQESSRVNFVLTAVELTGLLAVIVLGAWMLNPGSTQSFLSAARADFQWSAILGGVTVAFYAYIGFEDLSNLAEEAKHPARDLPRAILIAISVSTVIYILVTLALLLHVPKAEIAASKTPLLLVFEKAGLGVVVNYFALIAILAITNTGLINLIMASRLMYGMAQEELLPKALASVHAGRRTPWLGVLVAGGAVLHLVFTGSLKVLAQTTSFLILVVFLLVHLSLLKLRWQKHPHDGMQFHSVIPALGILLCGVLLTNFDWAVVARSGILLVLGFLVCGAQCYIQVRKA